MDFDAMKAHENMLFEEAVSKLLPEAKRGNGIASLKGAWINPIFSRSYKNEDTELIGLWIEAASCPWNFKRPVRKVMLKAKRFSVEKLVSAVNEVSEKSNAQWALVTENNQKKD